MELYISIPLILLLIILNGVFAASEMALVASNISKVEEDSLKGNKKAKKVLKFMDKPTKFLSAIQIGTTILGFISGFLAADAIASKIVLSINPSDEYIEMIRIIVFIGTQLFLTFITVVFGELVPKSIAMNNPEKIAYRFISIISIIALIFRPLVFIFSKTATGVARLLKVNPEASDDELSEKEIRLLVSRSGKKGFIHSEESEMINNIFEFDDTTVEEIMTHKPDISAINLNWSREEIADYVANEKYTRFPVYEDTIDNIIGTFHVKDLIKYYDERDKAAKGKRRSFNLRVLLRDVFFVPEFKKTSILFKEMKQRKTHIAIVLDEYGSTAGLITLEDLIEEILGDINDEYDEEILEIETKEDGVYEVDGFTSLDDLAEELKIDLPLEEIDTVSGFMISTLGRFPEENEIIEFDFNGYHFKSLELDNKIVSKVLITKNETPETEFNDPESED